MPGEITPFRATSEGTVHVDLPAGEGLVEGERQYQQDHPQDRPSGSF